MHALTVTESVPTVTESVPSSQPFADLLPSPDPSISSRPSLPFFTVTSSTRVPSDASITPHHASAPSAWSLIPDPVVCKKVLKEKVLKESPWKKLTPRMEYILAERDILRRQRAQRGKGEAPLVDDWWMRWEQSKADSEAAATASLKVYPMFGMSL